MLRVIEEHGYRPSHFGRALAERRHGALGLVFPGLSGPYFSELIQGFEAEALETGDSVLVLASHRRADTDATVIDLAGRVDGMAIHGGTVSDAVARAGRRADPRRGDGRRGRPGARRRCASTTTTRARRSPGTCSSTTATAGSRSSARPTARPT